MSKRKILIITLATIISICFAVGIILVCVLNLSVHNMKEVKISQENGVVAFSSDNPSIGNGYIFKFKSEKEEVEIETNTDLLVLKDEDYEKFTLGEKYQVSVCVKGEIESANSSFSKPVEWTASKYLKSPEISIESSVLSWEEIDDAESYIIYYNPQGKLETYECEVCAIDLGVLEGGDCDIFVKAVSSKSYYLPSVASNTLENIHIIHSLRPVREMRRDGKELIVFTYENIDRLKVYLGENENSYTEYTFVDFDIIGYGNLFKITCSIDLIYNNEAKIGAAPSSSDAYNSYTGVIVWINA